jgi:hypothetical protein
LGPDNRIGLYVGDSWKAMSNLTISLGLRYDRDTGRTDSDLPANADINAAFPGAGNPIKQANMNFAPQLGIAWDPMKNGKTVIRAGAGLYYENVIYNNVLFDRPLRLKTGAFNAVTLACTSGVAGPVPVAGGSVTLGPGVCGNHIGSVIPQILSFWNTVKAGNPTNLQAPNPNYIGNLLGIGVGLPLGLFDPNYKTPRSLQMNVGIQHEIRHGMVFTADYLRNVETRSLLGVDINHVGDVSTFNQAAALSPITATNSTFGCPAGTAGINCAIAAGASMANYAQNGLGTPVDLGGVGCTGALGIGRPCAFGGINSAQNNAFQLKPIGRSVYNALQMTLKQNVNNPMRGVKAANFQVSYSLSRFSNTGGIQLTGQPADNDQDFVLQAADNNNPGRYYGPSLLDRTNQISFGGYVDVPMGFRIGLISHFYSPLSSSIDAPNSGAPGDIFRTDFTGDGTIGDPIPGTKFGSFDRSVNASGLTQLLANFNQNVAGTATPAGQLLVSNGLFTLTQLQSLGGVIQQVALPPSNQVNFGWLRATDLKLDWRHTFLERYTIEPSVGFYNLFNFANFNLPPTLMNGILSGAGSGSINGTTPQANETFRVSNGTGVYSLGAQRQLEFGLRLTF